MSNNLLSKTFFITALGQTILDLTFPQAPSAFTFSILISNGASYTLLTSIAQNGTLVPDNFYNNYSQNAQGQAINVGAFAINVLNLGISGTITIEIKILS